MILEFARADRAGDPYAFRFVPQEYLLRSAGGGFESAELAWSEALLADLDAVRRPGRDPVILARLGELLRRFLMPLGWAQHEQKIAEACGRGERVVLTIRSAAAELYALPWELVTLKATGQHLGELPSLLLRYEWPETATAAEAPSPRPSGGRILFAWSAAGGAVPAAEHLAAIRSACAAGYYPFDTGRDVLANASYQRLSDALAQARSENMPIAVLHLLCHGAGAGSTFGLAWNGDDPGEGRAVVDAGRLRQLLAPHAGMVRLVVLQACDSSNTGVIGNQLGSVAQALHRAGIATVLASRYPLSVSGSIRLTQALYSRLLVELDPLESAVLAARKELEKDTEHIDWAGVQLYARAADGDDTRPFVFRPYRGLAAFHPSDRRFYFGRERDIERIVKLLSSGSRLVTVVGASGAGKSSLILAGVVPVLERRSAQSRLRVRVVRPSATPCLALALALCAADGQARSSVSPVERAVAELHAGLVRRRETLAELAAATPNTRLLMVVDQSEELFSQSDRTEAAAFIDGLMHAVSIADGQVAVVLTLRADFLGVCLEQPALAEPVRATMELILPLGREDLRQAILRPAARVGLRFEEGLVDALLDALCDAAPGSEHAADGERPPDRTLAAHAGGNLPLLQFTLEQLWERRSGDTITWHTWRSIGGVRGAITRRADEVLEASRKSDEPGLVQKLFGRLVQLGEGTLDTRRRAQREEIEAIAPGRMGRIVDRWVEARLLTADESEVTIAHEALLYEWETLRRWIDDSRESLRILQRLSRDARHYFASGESADDLWHGTPLRRALVLQAEGKLQLAPEEAEFLQRSAQAAARQKALLEEEARRARDLDRGLGDKARTFAVLLLIAVSGAGHAVGRALLPEVTHEMYMAMAVLVGGIGVLIMRMLRRSSIYNEFNRRTLSLCLSAPLPIFVNHWIGRVFGFPAEKSTVIDLNAVLMLSIAGAITLDRRLSLLVALNLAAILIATRRPQWIGPIMAIVPTLCILFMFALFHRHSKRAGTKLGAEPAAP
ncbi:MAG: CHAT domain-containing protein [Polyangia bacterium]